MKLGLFIPSEKKYIIKKLSPDTDDETKTLRSVVDRNEFVDYEGLTKDARTTNYQLCNL